MKLYENSQILEDMDDIYKRNIDFSRLDNSTVMVTGAYGMLASELVYFLIYLNEIKKYNIKIVAAVRNKQKLYNKFGEYCKRDYFSIYDRDLEEKISFKGKIDYIIHAASLANPNYYSKVPIEVFKPNIIGTYNLLEYCRKEGIKSFLLFSTGDIYGKVNGVNEIDENVCGITDTLDIHSCYGESKRMAETMCKSYAVQEKINTKIVRIFHTYGPTMDIGNDPRVFASFVFNIVNNEDIVMKSAGYAKRSFCYITDAISAFIKVLIDGEISEAYNVCNSNEFISIRELAEMLTNIYPEKKLKVIIKERDKNDCYLESPITSEAIPSNKKIIELGAEFKVSCYEGFKRTINTICDKMEKEEIK